MQLYAPMNYVNLLIFETLLKYENKRSISVRELEFCGESLMMDLIDDCATGDVPEEYLNQDIFIDIDEDYCVDDFIEEYFEYFTREGNIISLDDSISYEQLDELIDQVEEEEEIEQLFIRSVDAFRSSIFNYLDIHTIKDKINNYLALEQQMEQEYLKEKPNVNKIMTLMTVRELYYNHFMSLTHWKKEAYYDTIQKINSDYLSEPENEYEKSPIDQRLWSRSVYAASDESLDIEERIYNIDFYAIFGEGSSASNKISYDLEHLILFGNNFQGEKKQVLHFQINHEDNALQSVCEDDSYEFMHFYLAFINKIDEYLLEHGKDEQLIKLRKRILYIIDRPDLCLFKQENLTNLLKQTKEVPSDYEYDFIMSDIDFLADEIFVNSNKKYITKKLLLVLTFYSLTKQENIKLNLLDHCNNKYFQEYYDFIMGKEILRDDDKKLIK